MVGCFLEGWSVLFVRVIWEFAGGVVDRTYCTLGGLGSVFVQSVRSSIRWVAYSVYFVVSWFHGGVVI